MMMIANEFQGGADLSLSVAKAPSAAESRRRTTPSTSERGAAVPASGDRVHLVTDGGVAASRCKAPSSGATAPFLVSPLSNHPPQQLCAEHDRAAHAYSLDQPDRRGVTQLPDWIYPTSTGCGV